MKGYVKVKKELIEQALRNVQAEIVEGEALIDKGIALYYEKNFVNRGKLFKWWNRKYEGKPEEFTGSRIPMFHGWTTVFGDLLSKEELKIINSRRLGMPPFLKSLLLESADGTILIDNEVCTVIKVYTENHNK